SWRRSERALANWRAWKRHCRTCTRDARDTGRCGDVRLSRHSPTMRRTRTQHRNDDMDANAERALKDPVCGMSVSPESGHYAVHQGQAWRFCGEHCRERFEADPQAILE